MDVYADSVISGDIVAGPLVRLACQRHVKDRARVWEYRFDEGRADHAIEFFETVLKLPDGSSPFLLQPWQAFIVGSLFGWVDQQGYRRFREAYIEIGKGNGKTPLAAGIGLYGLVADGERHAQIYAAAADQDQAKILFKDAINIVDASPSLDELLRRSGGHHVWQLNHDPSGSYFQTFSRESGSKSGTRPHIALLDELHEHKTSEISIKVRAGAKGRRQPLFMEITNSGFDRTSICWEHHEHSRKVVEQSTTDDRWFAYVCALDTGDDPLEDESCWIKANPNLGISVPYEYLRNQVKNAKNLEMDRNYNLRLNFCVWTLAHTRAIDIQAWMECPPLPQPSELVGVPSYAGLDLGMSDDFSAWVRIWPLDDGRIAVKCRFWIPQAAFEKYPNRPYDVWRRKGLLTVTEGDITDLDLIERTIIEECRTESVREIAIDRHFAMQMMQHLIAEGLNVKDQPQGQNLNEGIRRKMDAIIGRKLCHGFNDVLTWMAANYVIRKSGKDDEFWQPAKEKAADKIDGQVALDMAFQSWLRQPVQKPIEQIGEWV